MTRAKKKSVARRFQVKAKLTNFELAKAKSALRLRIYSRGEKIGELQVGRGSLYWSGAHRQKDRRIRWGEFVEKMDALAYGKK